jgi:hypothetical protein
MEAIEARIQEESAGLAGVGVGGGGPARVAEPARTPLHAVAAPPSGPALGAPGSGGPGVGSPATPPPGAPVDPGARPRHDRRRQDGLGADEDRPTVVRADGDVGGGIVDRPRRAPDGAGRPRRLRPAPHRRHPAVDPRPRRDRRARRVPEVSARRPAEDALQHHDAEAAGAVRERARARHELLDPGQGPVPRQHLPAAGRHRVRDACHPVRDPAARDARHPRAGVELRLPAARVRAGDRPDRVRQVDDARVDHRPRQPQPGRAHHDRRGPDRVPPQPQAVGGQPA